jgi:hypothetical protein
MLATAFLRKNRHAAVLKSRRLLSAQNPAVRLTEGSSVFQIEPGVSIPDTQHQVVHAKQAAGMVDHQVDDRVQPHR